MYTSDILLPNIDAIKKFVTLTNQYDFPIFLATDRYRVDAKSVMGIFSLDLTQPLRMEIDADESGADAPRVRELERQLQQFQSVSSSVSER